MSELLVSLPPLSPDYSGAASALHDLGALIVIHDASGCTGTYCGYDEPRWFGGSKPAFCSGLREMDAVLGDDDKLLEKMRSFAADVRPPLAAVIGSPVPMVVGFDFQGFAALAEAELGFPTLGFATNGLGYYDEGQKLVYAALERRFVADREADREAGPEPARPSVNLLGASPLDGLDAEAVDSLEALAAEAGLAVESVWGSRSPLEELRRAGRAQVNWVLSAAALPLARRLEARFGQTWIAGLPFGQAERARLVSGLREAAAGLPVPAPLPPCRSAAAVEGEPSVLIVAEALQAASLAAAAGPSGRVQAATLFASDPSLPSVRHLECEASAASALASSAAAVGDPLLAELAPVPAFLPLPHCAVSGRLHRDSRARLFGAAGDSIFSTFLGGLHDS